MNTIIHKSHPKATTILSPLDKMLHNNLRDHSSIFHLKRTKPVIWTTWSRTLQSRSNTSTDPSLLLLRQNHQPQEIDTISRRLHRRSLNKYSRTSEREKTMLRSNRSITVVSPLIPLNKKRRIATLASTRELSSFSFRKNLLICSSSEIEIFKFARIPSNFPINLMKKVI